MYRRIQWIVALATLLMLTWAVVVALKNADYFARGRMFGYIAIVLFLSPGIFWLVPRAWLASPRAMLLTWWIVPVVLSYDSATYLGDIGETYLLEPFYVLVAGFWAMFAPVIVVGVRRAILERRVECVDRTK